MPRFAANLSWLFTERPLVERFAAARAAGFGAVEILFPYEEPAAQLAEAARLAGVPVVLINCPPPNWTGGPRGYAALPGGEARFEKDFERALRFAGVLGARHLHLMAGAAEGSAARATFLRNLRWAAGRAPGQSLTVEPINRTDMPGYFLADFREALEIVEAVGAPNLRLQFDAYHAQMIHGDVPALWQLCAPRVAHVQIAGVPGRNEPEGGEIDYPAFFAALDRDGYGGWVSAEYRPRGTTEAGLGWLARAV
ncbi:MAG: TIM barrel protein [Rhodobacteraceae bacterium]|nr:TIM barrel protein [Paracoccaceae bacterium]